MSVCASCGASFEPACGRGRPRIRCVECSPKKLGYSRRPKVEKTCDGCGGTFTSHMSTARWCSTSCRQASRMRPCAECGKMVHHSSTSAAVSVCLDCRRSRPAPKPVPRMEAWSCLDCGAESSRPATKGQRPKWCDACRVKNRKRDGIPRSVRAAVYDRDAWTCWLCEEDVDPALVGSLSPWRPSLDHVTPRSRGGSNDPSNLRLAHQWCNSVRSDGRTHAPEDFRAVAA